MLDFFGNLARLVLGLGADVQPRLPPRFTPWPNLPPASPLGQAPEPVDEPATAEATPFPPPLIGPERPAIDAPLPSFRQLSQVGTGPGSPIQQVLPPGPQAMPERADAGQRAMRQAAPPAVGQTREPSLPPPAQPVVGEAEPGEPGPMPNRPVTPLVPEPAQESATAPKPAPVLQRVGPAQGHRAPTTSPLQRASPSQAGDMVPLGYASPGQAHPPADARVRPLIHPPALEPPAAPEPAAVLQRQGAPEAELPAPSSPASTPPQTQPVAGQERTAAPPAPGGDQSTAALADSLAAAGSSPEHDRPTLNTPGAPRRRAGTAQGDRSASISPLQPASPYQPGDESPGEARSTGNLLQSAESLPAATRDQASTAQATPPTPLVHELALELPVTPGPTPVVQRQAAPPASTVTGTSGPRPPAVLPLGERRTGRAETIEPLDRRAAEPGFGSVPAPAEAAAGLTAPGPATRPPQPIPATGQRTAGPRRRQVPDAARAVPDSREPAIVPMPEPAPADRLPVTAERPARPAEGQAGPPPTVRVTIGRIEVRTAPPPPAPVAQRPEPARPALSLDDYLKAGPGGEP
jgi:hypothetical protein